MIFEGDDGELGCLTTGEGDGVDGPRKDAKRLIASIEAFLKYRQWQKAPVTASRSLELWAPMQIIPRRRASLITRQILPPSSVFLLP